MASLEEYMGSIDMMALPFTIRGYALADGSLMPVNQNTALYTLLGTNFGGDGVQSFALPDLRGRVPVGTGTGLGLSPTQLGQAGGSAAVQLTQSNLPPHVHEVTLGGSAGSGSYAVANASTATPSGVPAVTSPAGSGVPFPIMQPYLGVNYQIALAGMFPSRD